MATNTAASFTNHTGNGSAGPFSISFSYLTEAEVDVTVDGVLKTITTHYTFTSATQITFTSGNEPANSAVIKFQRDTDISSKNVDFQDGSVLIETDLDNNTDQLLFALQEVTDNFVRKDGSQVITGDLVFEGSIDDTNETTLAITNPTADRTITLPDTTGTVVTTGDTGTVSNTMLAGNSVDSSKITDGSIVNADINASAAIDGSKLQAASSSNAGSMSASDKSKLDAIESTATGDQSNSEIKTAYEANSDTNAFTDAEKTKLSGIEASATADQTASEIRTLVESASDSNVFTDADHTKLNAIEASADVTDATNVDAAGAVMNTDLGTKGQILVGDGSGDPSALSVGTNNYVLVADSSEATGVKWATVPAGSGMSNLVEDTSPQLGGNLDVNGQDIVSVSNGDIDLDPNGSGKIVAKGNATRGSGQVKLNCEQNSHGVIIKGPPHSAAQDYTLTLPSSIVNGQFLKTDSSGNLSWAAIDLTALSASNLTSGTVPDARFPATLPAASAANLTSIPAGNLTGTVADARISALTASKLTGALPAISGASLTSLPAANLTGTLPAISAANLTSIPAANITGTLPAISATNLTNIPAANITGTLPAISGANLTAVDAATVDGIDSASFLRSDAADSASGLLTLNGGIALTGGAAANITALSDGATITIDMATACHHSVTLGGNRTFAAPSNQVVGQSGSIIITQDGTGSRTAAFNAAFKFVGGTAPTLSTAANAVDRIDYLVTASNVVHAVISLDVK